MSGLLEFVKNIRIYGDAIGLALLPFALIIIAVLVIRNKKK